MGPSGPVDRSRLLSPPTSSAGGLDGGLRLLESKFGCGWIVSGSHSSLGVSEHKLTNAAKMLMSSVAAESDANNSSHFPPKGGEGGDVRGPGGGHTELPTTSVHLTQKHVTMPEFFMSEDLGGESSEVLRQMQELPRL